MLRALALSLALALPTAGAASAYFEPDYTPKPIADLLDFDARYDAAIPTPEAVLGYQSGEIIFTPEMHAAYIHIDCPVNVYLNNNRAESVLDIINDVEGASNKRNWIRFS